MAATPAHRENKQLSPLSSFRDLLERQTSQFAMVLPKETVEKFKRILVTTLSDNPELLRCSPRSLISVCMHAAQDGLMLDGREAAIVPFKSGPDLIAQYIPMVAGLRKKVRASKLLSDWNVQVVQEGDQFDYALGDAPYIRHKPALRGGRKRPVIGAYSIATFPDGTRSFEFMNVDQIEDIRSKSKARGGPWSDPIFYPEMCRKTVARLHAKQLPMSSDIEGILAREDARLNAIEHETAAALPSPSAPASVVGTLDEFGAGTSLSPPATDAASAARSGSATMQEASADAASFQGDVRAPDDQAVAAAYTRGQEDKAKGAQRKAIPGEYREDKRLWQAWLDGYDNIARS